MGEDTHPPAVIDGAVCGIESAHISLLYIIGTLVVGSDSYVVLIGYPLITPKYFLYKIGIRFEVVIPYEVDILSKYH